MYRGGYVYIMTCESNTVLYTGVTSHLKLRMQQHKEGSHPKSFTKRYKIKKLVYYEGFFDIAEAIAREKQIKAGSRKKKIDLINSMNPEWKDLYDEYCKNA
jgi:putative endonuclease